MTVETRIFHYDWWVVNGQNCKKLILTWGDHCETFETLTDSTATEYEIGIRVYKVDSGGTRTEITSTQVAIAVVAVPFNGVVSATWSCPLTSLNSTDAVLVQVWARRSKKKVGTWYLLREFITEQLTAQSLDSATWTVYYAVSSYEGDALYFWQSHVVNCPSRIENFTWTPAPPAYVPVMKFHQKGTTTIYLSG